MLPKLSKKLSFQGSGVSYNQKQVPRNNQLQNAGEKSQFSPEIAHYGTSLIPIFYEFFARIDKIFILTGTLDISVSFYEV